MPEIEETRLPGVGVRHELTTAAGERLAILTHRNGRRELAVYDRDDPDRCTSVLHLSPDDARSLAEVLGGSQVGEAVAVVQQQVEGLAIAWITIGRTSSFVGSTIGEGAFRTRTGASIVALLRGGDTIPAPEPTTAFAAGDVVVAVGTSEGLDQLRSLLEA